jgi:hypothetical protein
VLLVCWLRFACLVQEMRTRSEWRLALALVDRLTPGTDTATGLRLARMAITAMPPMPVRLTDTTALTGSSAGSSLAPAPGSVGVASTVAASTVVGSMVAAVSTVAGAFTADADSLVIADSPAADSMAAQWPVAASAEAGSTAAVDSTAAVAEASTVVEAVTDK